MAAETRVYNELLLVVRFGKLEEENLGREVVNVGKSQSLKALVELMGDDLS